MSGDDLPATVARDIEMAVRSAIDSGVTVMDFRKWAAILWDVRLVEKRDWDAKDWRKPL